MGFSSQIRIAQNQSESHSPASLTLDEIAEDSELLAIFIETKSRPAADAIVRRHSPMVAGVIRRMIQNPSDAEDAFQATFLIFFQSARKIQKHASLSAWLYGVAYRTACRVRKRAKQVRVIGMSDSVIEPSEMDNPLEKIATESQLELLDRELNNLQPQLRETLIEHHLLGFSAPKIAERLNMSVSAVEGRLRRGRASLRQLLARRGISFSVSFAVAAAYQQNCVAVAAESWTQDFLRSALYSQTITSEIPATDPTLFDLIQGEIAMKSLFAKWASLTGAAACLAVGVAALQFLPSTDGDSMKSTALIAAASADETSSGYTTILAQQVAPTGNTTNNSEKGSGTLALKGANPEIVQFTKPAGSLPNWMTEGGTIAEEEEAAREEIRRKIRVRVSPDFKNTPLQTVLEKYSSELQIPIRFDTVALDGMGRSPDEPVTLSGIPDISFQRAMRLILDPLELAYVIEPDHIMVTSKDEERSKTLRYYELAHFLPSDELINQLIVLIQTMIKGNWATNGGEDSIQAFGSMLVVSAPEKVHLEIERLLFQLSKMDKANLIVPKGKTGGAGMGSGGMF